MRFLYDVVVLLHLLGMACLVGGFLATLARPRVTPLMLWGARGQLVTGLVLVGMAFAIDSLDRHPDPAKMVVKLVLSLVAAATAEIWTARSKRATATAAEGGSGRSGSGGAAAATAPPVVLVQVCGAAAFLATAVAALWH